MQAEIVICGAGLAGAAAAYHLSAVHGIRDVVLIDERPPLSLTSSSSTECYRNWWPGPGDAMVRLMNRSIDLLEQIAVATDNRIQLNRRGYLFATANPAQIAEFIHAAQESEQLGAGPARVHRGEADDPEYVPSPAEGWQTVPSGADVLVDRALIRRYFPYLAENIVAVIHARRCGWLSAQALGNYLLEQAQANGARLISGRVVGVDLAAGRVQSVQIADSAIERINTPCFVNAAGPGFKQVGALIGLELPVFCELHLRTTFASDPTVLSVNAPMLIAMDSIPLYFGDDDRPDDPTLLQPFPAGVHMRPAGTPEQPLGLGLWTFDTTPRPPVFPPVIDPQHAEITLRGLASLVPGLQALVDRGTQIHADGGYYTKTAENRPLIGPTPIAGAFLMGAISGFGVMGACAFGELLAAHITGGALPDYAPAFLLSRYDDPNYQQLLGRWGSSGQL